MWSRGRDSNPGPPPYQSSRTRGSSKKSAHKVIESPTECLEITEGLVSKFMDWLRGEGVGERTLRTYEYHLKRLVGLTLCGKSDVTKVFNVIGINDKSYKAFSRLLTYVERKLDGYEGLVLRLRKAMPKRPKPREDTYVPPDTLILDIRNKIRDIGPPYTLIYNVMVSSGCRCKEALYTIENIHRLKAVGLGEFVRVHVDLQRGSKNEFALYMPKEVYQQLLKWEGKLPHEDTVEKKFKELGLGVKYFRKWWRQLLKRLKIDSEDIEAFQGRVSSIGGRHYTDWIPVLDEDFRKILPHIREFVIIDQGGR